MIDPQLLKILACPVTKAPLVLSPKKDELWCKASHMAYPIRDDIPVLLENEARKLSEEEYEQLK